MQSHHPLDREDELYYSFFGSHEKNQTQLQLGFGVMGFDSRCHPMNKMKYIVWSLDIAKACYTRLWRGYFPPKLLGYFCTWKNLLPLGGDVSLVHWFVQNDWSEQLGKGVECFVLRHQTKYSKWFSIMETSWKNQYSWSLCLELFYKYKK